jgi:hypothetical protein
MADTQRLGAIEWNGLVFGPGSAYHVTALSGLDDLPGVRAEDEERTGQHGDYSGPDYVEGRTIQLGLSLVADTPDELRALTLALRAATQPQRTPLPLTFVDWGALVYGKIRKRALPYDAEHLWRTGTAALEIYCPDPYVYGVEEKSTSTTAYSPSVGRTYPLVHPRTYGAMGTTGRMTAVNAGAADAFPVLRLDGPVAAPSIEHVGTGSTLVVDGTLQPGEFLLIDTRTRAVLLNGSAPRRTWVRAGSVWPLLLPGTNELVYRGSALAGAPGQASLLTVTWRDTTL